MKKSLYLLAALSLLGTNVFAKEVVAPAETSKEVIVEPVVVIEEAPIEEWKFNGRAYLEMEDFDNGSTLASGDDEDGTFFGTGISATKGKLTLDLNVEKRLGGDLSSDSNPEWESLRADWKVRYQLFESQAFHLKYRNETRTRDFSQETYHDDWRRNRFELGTDFNHFNGMLAGWLVVGYDRDKQDNDYGLLNTNKNNGWYWEGDFGPSFKLTEKLSLNPTVFTTGEFYDTYEMVETQIRVMMPYQATEKLTIMPRIRFTLERTFDEKDSSLDGKFHRKYDNKPGSKIRYELMANYVINEDFSTFVGVAYESNTRTYKNEEKFAWGPGNGDHDIDLWWTYVGLNYKFN